MAPSRIHMFIKIIQIARRSYQLFPENFLVRLLCQSVISGFLPSDMLTISDTILYLAIIKIANNQERLCYLLSACVRYTLVRNILYSDVTEQNVSGITKTTIALFSRLAPQSTQTPFHMQFSTGYRFIQMLEIPHIRLIVLLLFVSFSILLAIVLGSMIPASTSFFLQSSFSKIMTTIHDQSSGFTFRSVIIPIFDIKHVFQALRP